MRTRPAGARTQAHLGRPDMANRAFGSYRSMSTLALAVGIVTVALQFLPDLELLSFMLAAVALGSLVGGEGAYDEADRLRLARSYKFALEWLFMAAMAAYALIEFSKWLGIMQGAAAFLNDRWPALILSMICLLMGLAGSRKQTSAVPQTNDLRRPSV